MSNNSIGIRKPLPKTNETISYKIHSWSSYSANFHPRNVLINNPNDQASRWSTANNSQAQFIILELETICVPKFVTFGKFKKVHVCNLKEFKVYGGLNPTDMVEILHNGLKNDEVMESFPLKNVFKKHYYPMKYIKISPLAAWGANFNLSLWYVEISGIKNPSLVKAFYDQFIAFRENEAIKLCLKFFRQKNYQTAFNSLTESTKITLEDEVLTQLYHVIVENGDYAKAEEIIDKAKYNCWFDEYIQSYTYTPVWTLLHKNGLSKSSTHNSGKLTPRMRGGHQMCMDEEDQIIFLIGGWDGKKDLGDFWKYDIKKNCWIMISENTTCENGPGPRSCHKICYDNSNKHIYVFGKFVETEYRRDNELEADFYRYHVTSNRWEKISNNVTLEHGPELTYDHQMCFDPEDSIIYFFGGRTVHPDPNEVLYSGLFAYDTISNTWHKLRSDDIDMRDRVPLKGRIGHSMILDHKEKCLYIMAGQRNKDYFSDVFCYDIDSDTVIEKQRDYSIIGGPSPGLTQRITFDSRKRELYMFSGLIKDKSNVKEIVRNTFWTLNIEEMKWSKVYQNDNSDLNSAETEQPCPRFAHQLVYDSKNQTHYLFGGNPGDSDSSSFRLDDFWKLDLVRPDSELVARHIKYKIREQNFHEICYRNSTTTKEALFYLRTKVNEVIDHQNQEESEKFKNLAKYIFSRKNINNYSIFEERIKLYEKLVEYFPSKMKQPSENIVDLINFAQ